MAPIPSREERDSAALALLRALGVKDVENVVGFVLTCRVDDVPTLVVERFVGPELGDKTTQVAAAALHPAVEERAVF